MKKLATYLVAIGVGITLLGGAVHAADLNNPDGDKVCQPQGAHIDGRNRKVITETIQDGLLITGYCVKAGSVKNGHGPHYVTLDEPAKTVEITHPSGKQISHYVVFWRPIPPFNHNWQYADPTCESLFVDYPANLPNPQNANHVNIRISGNGQTVTLNWHTSGTWAPSSTFVYADHPQWPGFSVYTVEWVQVAESNYHWSGSLECGTPPPTTVPPTTVPPTTVPPTIPPPPPPVWECEDGSLVDDLDDCPPPPTTVPPTTVPPTTVPPTIPPPPPPVWQCDDGSLVEDESECPPPTTVPETTVPETTVPETTVPETTVPETTTTTPEVTTTTPEVTTTVPETACDNPDGCLPKTGTGMWLFTLGLSTIAAGIGMRWLARR